MGVNESTLDEMFNERAHYLFNIDELLLEELDKQVHGKRISSGYPYTEGFDRLGSVRKIKVVEQLSTTSKYKKFGESLELIPNKKLEPICLRKLRNHEL